MISGFHFLQPFFALVFLSSCFGLLIWSDTRPNNKTCFMAILALPLPFLFLFFCCFALLGYHFLCAFVDLNPRAEMNQRLLAWHCMNEGMDYERKEGWQ